MKNYWLNQVCVALGWQGGTIHQVIAEIERLRAVEASLSKPPLTDAQIEHRVDGVLRAAGSALRHYTLQKSRDDMRAAMRSALADEARS